MKTTQHDLSILPCQHLTGVGKRIAEKLQNIGIQQVQDLLFHLPSRYQDRTRIFAIRDLRPGDHAVIEGEIETISFPKGGRTRLLCRIKDKSGRLSLRFFFINADQRLAFTPGIQIRCFGEIRLGGTGLEMIHPEYRILSIAQLFPVDETLTPIYPTTEGLSQQTFRKLTQQALNFLKNDGLLKEILPDSILKEFTFPTLKEALAFVHRPPPEAPVGLLQEAKHISQQRLIFEELLAHRLSLLNLKNKFQHHHALSLPNRQQLSEQLLSRLAFQLTKAQQRVLNEITADLTQNYPMLRLVQGDVGSGKTIVAALAMLQAVENNTQAALLAPTELLVEQHYQNFQKWFMPLGVQVVMLNGQMKAAEKRQALQTIADGSAKIILGTHAIFQKSVVFKNLSLIVVDEQHRFGVEQRAQLREKGHDGKHFPHQLIMTATPIPRTLAMSVYADLDYSVIDELPPGRTPITTTVIANTKRQEVLVRIREGCASGRQAYWVCTLIAESETLQCQAAENTALELQLALPELNIGLIHGRMKSQEKDNIMQAFKNGTLHLLVATTVIEVGVDVPNASLMIIENAERLGLAQLHQLRGRVGRGDVASFCVLLYQAPLSAFAKERLNVMRETTDGFKVAERDLALRGPGEVLGTKQTGDVGLRIANLARDRELLETVQKAADIIQAQFPEIIPKLIHRWIRSAEKFGHV